MSWWVEGQNGHEVMPSRRLTGADLLRLQGGDPNLHPVHNAALMCSDPFLWVQGWGLQRDLAWSLPIGSTATSWAFTAPRQNMLTLGPPQTAKTTGVLIPQILSHTGPLVAASTKPDLYRQTAQTRRRYGWLYHFSPTPEATLPGTTQLRWSPVVAARHWPSAIRIASGMAQTVQTNDTTNGGYFTAKAGELLAALLHAGGLGERPIDWVLDAAAGREWALTEAHQILDSAMAFDALRDLWECWKLDDRSKGPIFSTAKASMDAYRYPEARATTENPNFDPHEFARGRLDGDANPDLCAENGFFDSVYITVRTDWQKLAAPIIVGLLSEIRGAIFDLAHEESAWGNPEGRAPTLWVLDELASLAPIPDLPQTLSQSGSQGLLISACMQDEALAKGVWKERADALLTLFGTIAVFPGILNSETTRKLAAIAGRELRTMESRTENQNFGKERSHGYSTQTSQQWIDRLTPGHITAGMLGDFDYLTGNPETDNRRMLVIGSGVIDRLWAMPYYAISPWRELLVQNAVHAQTMWTDPEDQDLPLPELDRHGFEHLANSRRRGLLDAWMSVKRSRR